LSEANLTFAHQFENADQQREAASFGMWIFLITEIMFFGGLFLAYTVYRNLYHPGFLEASHELNTTLGAINTAVLICSSLTMAFAVRSAQLGKRNLLVTFLLLTILLGSVFLGIKVVEYAEKFHSHHVPGSNFQFEGPYWRQAEIFFSLYFAMTGLHALHMIIGIGILSVLVFHSLRGRYSPAYFSPVELSGLYWHFVDIVWIFLFPLLYLLGRHLEGHIG
jgi:cytochrome c oxidase subunit 3